MTTTSLTLKAREIAAKTYDAYSRETYTDAGWISIIRTLLQVGASPAEAEWVVRSKHTRWAADAASRSHSATSGDFLRYANSPHVGSVTKLILAARHDLNPGAVKTASAAETRVKPGAAALAAYAQQHGGGQPVSEGADLAGACQGEDIAALIDFAKKVALTGTDGALAIEATRLLHLIRTRG